LEAGYDGLAVQGSAAHSGSSLDIINIFSLFFRLENLRIFSAKLDFCRFMFCFGLNAESLGNSGQTSTLHMLKSSIPLVPYEIGETLQTTPKQILC
jgi:hypothetical protein